ncbi:acyltransferase [Flavobacterium sp. CFBP9031]|uniref:acyltransferase family protein n=1 Tax=Flavobacterium sp. CFBP9031 TaxID=3096538 RepID=UPI002A6AABAE|nr:acyltransferase [Flavobacterium sp. CFBP9031]MDY0987420.1 acyltransferase [Flavobacterium sp. CFBP9031]
MTKNNNFFSNLNGVRFIAAAMVIISHIELGKSYFGIENEFSNLKQLGVLGVSLFFVLSGFLITFLLLEEKNKNGQVNLKFFYLRRILRIWPLYFLIVILSVFILPHIEMFNIPNMTLKFDYNSEFIKVIVLFLFFLTNILISIKLVPFATQTWSIGTEEQFYLIWPLVINKTKELEKLFIVIIVLYNILLILLKSNILPEIKYSNIFQAYIRLIQLDSLAFGALGACFLYKRSNILSKIVNNFSFGISLITLIFVVVFHSDIIYFKSSFVAICFIVIILNLVHNKTLHNILENKFFFKMGEISYGLYMYHQMVIAFCINCLLKYSSFNNTVLYIFTFVVTILISIASYKFLEKPFILKKDKYSFRN